MNQLSQPQYKVKVQKDVFVTTRDGTRLAADIYYPDAEGKFPTLLSYSLYSKEVQKLPVPLYHHSAQIGNGGIEAGDTEFFVSRGYVHVIADVRGSGKSEGAYGWFSMKEQEDGYDLVEWIGTQPWCNGNVGMLGMSYFAMIQYLVAAQNPPHLKAIFAYDPSADLYREWNRLGGILTWGFYFQWWPHLPVHTFEPLELSQAELDRRVSEAKNDPDIQRLANLYIALMIPEKNVLLFNSMVHPFDGPYYWERSPYTKLDRIKVPSYIGSRWNMWTMHLKGAFTAFEGINAPKKLIIDVPGLSTDPPLLPSDGANGARGPARPWGENQDIILRWYDHWLKGMDTGIMDEPPIKIFVQGANEWRYEHEWPLARTRWTKFYLRRNGMLSETPPEANEVPDRFTNVPCLFPGQEAPSLVCSTAPLTRDIEVTGPVALHFYASLSTEDANWLADLYDVDGDQSERLVTKGYLKASHRELDQGRSKPYQPFHPHTQSDPVEPGRVYEYAMEFRQTSNVFKAGHRIRLVIRGQEQAFPWGGLVPNSKETQHTIFHDREHQSYLLLPVIQH